MTIMWPCHELVKHDGIVCVPLIPLVIPRYVSMNLGFLYVFEKEVEARGACLGRRYK